MGMDKLIYDDLLSVPFKKGGRTRDGMDCYGVCIEMCRRCGKTLPDLATRGRIFPGNIPQGKMLFSEYIRQIQKPEPHCLVEYLNSSGEVHVGFMLTRDIYIHATEGGVRVTPLFAVETPKFYEVIR